MPVVDQYSLATEEEREIYFIDKIIEHSERELEKVKQAIIKLENKREKIILTQMEKAKGI